MVDNVHFLIVREFVRHGRVILFGHLMNMGTGIVSILLHNLPYNGTWLYLVSVAVFCLNVAFFVSFLSISILR
jgi:tellurite resistance protein TehA-like permease